MRTTASTSLQMLQRHALTLTKTHTHTHTHFNQLAKAQLKELSTLAGVPLRDDVFDALVELTYLDIVPTAISQVVASLCKKANAVARSPGA